MKQKRLFKHFKWLTLVCLAILAVFIFRPSAMAVTEAKHYTELKFPELPEVQLPSYERYELNNGMVVYLMVDRELPLVSGTALIHTGSRLEPSEDVGLAQLTGIVMRSGGTLEKTPDELNQFLEQRAASVETGIGNSFGSASFNTLSENLDNVFQLFAEVVRYPAFREDQLALAKTQLRGSISRRNDNPGDIASREFRKVIYGESSPYARTIEYETIDDISRDNLMDFYRKYFQPEKMILGIVGDFEPNEMKQRIEKAFGDWQSDVSNVSYDLPSVSQASTSGVFFIERPELTQSNIIMGHMGGMLNNPDYPALSVLNGVLNGYGGRLFNELRSTQGLAYSVYGSWSPRFDYPGMFVAGGQTRSDATVDFVDSLLSEIKQLREEPISSEELAYAQESILNSFVFRFEDPSQTLSRVMRYEYFGYPSDFIFQYQRGVKATTIEDVQRVAQEYLQPEQIVTLVVGNQSEINPPLSSLGKDVKTVDVSIPQSGRS